MGNIQETDKLNKKLAEWLGFEIPDKDIPEVIKRNGRYGICPDFTNSLDECFKWLVPKLGREIRMYYSPYSGRTSFIVDSKKFEWGDKNSALDLCLAIEKLIDREVG